MLIKKINSKYSIILGSNSPRRREILKKLGFNFNVKVSSYDENINFKKYSAAKAVKINTETPKTPLSKTEKFLCLLQPRERLKALKGISAQSNQT